MIKLDPKNNQYCYTLVMYAQEKPDIKIDVSKLSNEQQVGLFSEYEINQYELSEEDLIVEDIANFKQRNPHAEVQLLITRVHTFWDHKKCDIVELTDELEHIEQIISRADKIFKLSNKIGISNG